MLKEAKYGVRNSKMFLNEVYFWTDTIKDWQNLLVHDECCQIIVDSWHNLVSRNKISIYSFVIMPNHLHVIWEMRSQNGKEMPYASFNKYTSHQFLEHLRKNQSNDDLAVYIVNDDPERKHRFWQRDPLAVVIDSRNKLEQKLDYIHFNPLQERWRLVDEPTNYKWSSSK